MYIFVVNLTLTCHLPPQQPPGTDWRRDSGAVPRPISHPSLGAAAKYRHTIPPSPDGDQTSASERPPSVLRELAHECFIQLDTLILLQLSVASLSSIVDETWHNSAFIRGKRDVE